MGDGKCSVLQYTGTDEHEKKRSLQRSFLIMNKNLVKNGYIC
jgi:hypothetical protein